MKTTSLRNTKTAFAISSTRWWPCATTRVALTQIGAKYRELSVPTPDQEECEPGNYKLWKDIVARKKLFHRLQRTLPFEQVVADGLAASRASAKVYFGTVPFGLHHAGIIYARLGEGGVLGRGQPVHVDVMLPELVLFHYIHGGVATNVYTPPEQLDAVALSCLLYTSDAADE